jgi:hypothetical protein
MDRTRDHGSGEEQLTLDAEVLDLDPAGRPLAEPPRPRGRVTRTNAFGPSAIAGAFLVCALTIGAAGSSLTAGRSGATDTAGAGPNGTTTTAGGAGSESALLGHGGIGDTEEPGGPGDGGTGGGGEAEEPTGDPGATGEPKETGEPTETAKPDPTEKPDPTDEPEPKPEVASIELALKLGEAGKVHVDWSGCKRDGFDAWKVVRSSNDGVSLPAGSGDTIVAAIDDPSRTWFVDGGAPKGKTSWYRVFGVAWQDGYVVLCKSNLAKIITPAPEPEPTPDPKPEPLGLALSLKDSGVYVDWTACGIDGFDLYKVVRSKDAEVRFPAGDHDSVIAATEDATAFLDKEAPAGRKLYYRVYCLDKGADGYRVLRYSAVKAITTPGEDPGPKPVPSHMGFDVDVTAEGIVLHWEACGGERFRYYKVIRSRSENPSYLPWTDGSEVIAVIEHAGTTTFVDTSADGGTWFYRVQSIGTWNGGKVLLGQTDVREATIE